MASLEAYAPSLEFDESFSSPDPVQDKRSAKVTKGKGSRKRPRRRKRMLTGVSKQRRAANERERRRLQIINYAFKDLKNILPLLPGEENISKIEIVRLASKTIRLLAQILAEDDHSQTGVKMESEEERSSCSSADSTESLDTLDSFDTDTGFDDLSNDMDFSFLLFPTDDIKMDAFGDSIDPELELPSPSISDSSCSSSKDSTEFPFMEDDPVTDDDVFCKGPTMILW